MILLLHVSAPINHLHGGHLLRNAFVKSSVKDVRNICLTSFAMKNGLKQGDALSRLLFIFALDNAIRRIQLNQHGLKLYGTVYTSFLLC